MKNTLLELLKPLGLFMLIIIMAIYLAAITYYAPNGRNTAKKDVANGYTIYLDGEKIEDTKSINLDSLQYKVTIDDDNECVYVRKTWYRTIFS